MGTEETEVTGQEGQGADESVQSSGVEEQSTSGQDLIAPYLEKVDPRYRNIVQPVLEEFRSEQDANFNRVLEQRATEIRQLREASETPVTIYQSLLQDPEGTVEWIVERFQEERGYDLRNSLAERWGLTQAEAQQVVEQAAEQVAQDGQQPTEEGERPLTRAELEEILNQQREEEARQQQELQATEQARSQVTTWINDAAKNLGLELKENDPLRDTIIIQAGNLQRSGQVPNGQAAIEMVVQSLTERFAPKPKGETKPQPRVAAGGGPVNGGKKVDVSNPEARREAMLEAYTALKGD